MQSRNDISGEVSTMGRRRRGARRLLLLSALLCAALLIPLGAPFGARAEPRIALVIGNAGYQSVGRLQNAGNDAALIAQSLRDVGFEVTEIHDADQAGFLRAVADFGRALRAAGEATTGLFYYAGHGVQSYGRNYLLPVDTALSDPADLDLVSVEAASVLRQMRSARNRTNFFILDACRNNPFEKIPAFNDNGLAEMKAPTGTFLAYATAPGDVASDGIGANSPFTEALSQELRTPGVPAEQVFKRVRQKVLLATQGAQTPWDASSLTADFSFVAATPLSAEEAKELQLYDSLQNTRDPVQIMLFLRAYPESRFATAARGLLAEAMEAELSGAAPSAAPPPPAPKPDENALFEAAQAAGNVTEWERYLAVYPDGVFAEIAASEIAALRAKEHKDPLAEPGGAASPPAAPAPAASAATEVAEVEVFYDRPLSRGGPEIEGRSLAQLIEGSPLFPPLDGLPEALWKGQGCANCHHWDRETLCTQGKFYIDKPVERAAGKAHPLGGGFKLNLRRWASQGCR